jgi:hypothetical protein
MPYAPGIQDISGQLLGRGIEAAAQARAQGMGAIGSTISNLFGTYAQKRAQDEEFMAKAKSMENFIKTHADDFAPVDPQTGQKNPDAVLQFLQQSPDENAKQKYMRLGSFLDTAVTGTKMQQAQAATRFENLRSDQAQAEIARLKALSDYQQKLLSQGTAETSVGTEPTSAMPAPQSAPVSGPASLGLFTQTMAQPRSEAQGMPAAGAQPVAATVQRQTILRDWLSSGTPPTIEDAQKELALGGDPNFMKNALSRQKEMFKEWKDNRAQQTPAFKVVDLGGHVGMMNNSGDIVKTISKTPTAPNGYAIIDGPNGPVVQPLPGSPQEQVLAEKNERERVSNIGRENTKDIMLNTIDSAIKRVSNKTAGAGAVLENIPATEARALANDITTIKANLGFDQLAKMRAASPTGGALGQIAVKELAFLQSTLGSLDQYQSPEELKKTLGNIRQSLVRWNEAISNAPKPEEIKSVQWQPGEQPGTGRFVPKEAKAFPMPNQKAIDYLKANPQLTSQFEQVYGPGSASIVLGR